MVGISLKLILAEFELKSESCRAFCRDTVSVVFLCRDTELSSVSCRESDSCRDTVSASFPAATRFRTDFGSFSETGITFAYELRFRRSTTQIVRLEKFYPAKLTLYVHAFSAATESPNSFGNIEFFFDLLSFSFGKNRTL